MNNYWFKTNIKEACDKHTEPFRVELLPYQFNPLSFQQATEYTINQLTRKYDKLYVAFSGGYDSLYIVQQLLNYQVDFVPVIVENPWTPFELEYAYHWCQMNKVNPHIIHMKEYDYLKVYIDVFKKWGNCSGPGIIQLLYAGLQCRDKGHLITGTTILDDGNWDPNIVKLFCAWDYYYELFDLNFELFFMKNLQMIDSIAQSIKSNHTRTDYFKSELYNLPYRPKFTIHNQSLFAEVEKKIQQIPNQRSKDNDYTITLDELKKFLSIYRA